MIFTMPLLSESFEIDENEIPILIVENKEEYQKIIIDLYKGIEGLEIERYFYIDENLLNLKKEVDIVNDLFSLNINSAKTLTKLYNYIKAEYSDSEKYIETIEISSSIMEYVDGIVQSIDFNLEYDESVDVLSIFKSINLRFEVEEELILSRLIDYVKVASRFLGKKLFVFTNFKSTLSIKEQEEFYKFAFYEKIQIFIIETDERGVKIDCEKYLIIDEDLCVLY